MADAAPLLEVEATETSYRRSQVLFGLSLSVRSGEMVAMMGRDGMGKTTTIRSIMGLTPARAGGRPVAGGGSAKTTLFPDRASGNGAGAGGASDISEPDGARKSCRRVRQPPGQPRSLG